MHLANVTHQRRFGSIALIAALVLAAESHRHVQPTLVPSEAARGGEARRTRGDVAYVAIVVVVVVVVIVTIVVVVAMRIVVIVVIVVVVVVRL
jgi:hypothetical protein